MRWKLLSPKKIVLPNGKEVLEKRSFKPIVWLILFVLTVLAIRITGFSLEILVNRIQQFFVILQQMIPPNWAYLSKLWQPLFDTIKMSLFGSIAGAICALPIAVLSATNITKHRGIALVSKFILSLLRTLPTLIIALIATFIFGLGTMAGTVAIFLFTIAYVGKLLYEQIENANMEAYEAMQSMGLTTIQSFHFAILPQILPNYLSTSLFCFEGNVRYASILGYVGAGGIGLLLNESLGWRSYENVGMILLMLVGTVFIIETTSEYFRKKLM
ncbi:MULTISPECIES: phosphonate ABC transporter, permease protein PhnE [Lysinibacillus]|uniref:Phosphonate ABC transporter, permease protein PhnE n=1 Tax=Lysinibacillus fusiformis TaxID=28031 RepID=A0A2I0V3S8_9BACI|nr:MULTISPECIES: phosphonate ABC transporter, permease protein PhnE [Lysinibacillus]KUF33066.1 phosphonate ABC transporter permease [Lysinibacillus sp. F5]PKU52938.1 phosphonate ABC transporter, permease protein PhnE [Lysinibacillus fusiformis]